MRNKVFNNMFYPKCVLSSLLFICFFTRSLTADEDLDKFFAFPMKSLSKPNEMIPSPFIFGLRAEHSKHPVNPIITDESGLTIVPESAPFILRLFGSNLFGLRTDYQIGFTTKVGLPGDVCEAFPNRIFTPKEVKPHMMVVEVALAESITDNPYYVCLADKNGQTGGKFFYQDSGLHMGIRVIGERKLIGVNDVGKLDKKNGTSRNSTGFLSVLFKSKLAQIVDQVENIHKTVDSMQEWNY